MGLLDYTTFLRESFLYEEKEVKAKKPTAWKAALAAKFKAFFPQAAEPVIDKAGNALRANFAPEETLARKQISDFFAGLKNKEGSPAFSDVKVGDPFRGTMDADYTFYDTEKGIETKNAEVGSGMYDAYKVDCDSYVFYVVNTGSTGKTVGKKKTTPDALRLDEMGPWLDAPSLVVDIKNQLDNRELVPDPKIAAYLYDCATTVLNQTEVGKWGDVNVLMAQKGKWASVEYKLNDEHSAVPDADKKDIVNDFGEVLDAVYLLKAVTNVKTTENPGLSFPKGSNNPLSDILLDGVRISCKSEKQGGKPSIQPVVEESISRYKAGTWNGKEEGVTLTPKEEELLNMFKAVDALKKVGQWLNSIDVYLYFAEAMNPKMEQLAPLALKRLNYLKSKIPGGLKKDNVIKYFEDTLKTPAKKEAFIKEYFKATGFKATKDELDYSGSALDMIAPIYYPLATEVVVALNKYFGPTSEEPGVFTTVMRKFISYHQLYLGISAKADPDTIRISGVSSHEVPRVEFYARASSNKWNAGMGFEWKLE